MLGTFGGSWRRMPGAMLACAIFVLQHNTANSQTISESSAEKPQFSAVAIAQDAYNDPAAPGQYRIPFEQLRHSDLRDLPIGVFDSGIGGLTVLETILDLDAYHNDSAKPGADGRPDFEGESFIYFGDQANMPYGNYGARGDINFLRELILRDAMFLLGTKSWEPADVPTPVFTKTPVKAIVIACNTATAYGLEDIRQAITSWKVDIPVIGVVEAGANALVHQLPTQGPPETIAVLATVGTCKSNAYPNAVRRAAGLAGKRVPNVVQQGSVGLAGAIEGNPSFIRLGDSAEENPDAYQGPGAPNVLATIRREKLSAYEFDASGLIFHAMNDSKEPQLQLNSVENYVRYDVTELIESYAATGGTTPITKVILGCTHFPFESDRIRESLKRLKNHRTESGDQPYAALIAEKIELIDPAELTARDLFKTLFASRMQATTTASPAKPKVQDFYFSVANPENGFGCDSLGNLTDAYKYGRKMGWADKEDTIVVPLTVEAMPEAISRLLRAKCKLVWEALLAIRQE